MGTGTSMSGSNMFIIYTAGNGQNITLSPRKSSGRSMPQSDSSIQAELLDGSGVSGSNMVANIKCEFLLCSCSCALDVGGGGCGCWLVWTLGRSAPAPFSSSSPMDL